MSLRSIRQLMAAALALGALAPVCAAHISSKTALTEELRSLRAGSVITPASGAAYNDSLQGASTSGLPSDIGINPAIIVRPEGQLDMPLSWLSNSCCSLACLLGILVARHAPCRADFEPHAVCR